MDEKPNTPHSHIPYGKDGTGSYSEHNTPAYQVSNACIPLIVDAVQHIDIEPGSTLTAVDYGAADGGVSMRLWYSCVKAVREKHGNELPITIIYEDQPVNDFKSVFMRTQGLIPSTSRIYLHDFPNVYVLVSGTSFFQQCFPDNTVNFGFSSTAMQWLSKKPCDLKETTKVELSSDEEEIAKFREQAKKDWEQILMMRAAELVPGGCMVICVPATDEFGQFTCGPSQYAKVGMTDFMTSIWRTLRDEGIISKKEFVMTNFYVVAKTKEEFMEPFEKADSPVIQAGLELVSIEIRLIPNPLREIWLKEKGNFRGHAKRVVAAAREWSNSTFMNGLSDTRSTEEKQQIVDEMYLRCEEEISKNPEDYGWDFIYACVVICKSIK